jgi:hypothetical protein
MEIQVKVKQPGESGPGPTGTAEAGVLQVLSQLKAILQPPGYFSNLEERSFCECCCCGPLIQNITFANSRRDKGLAEVLHSKGILGCDEIKAHVVVGKCIAERWVIQQQ